MGLETEIYQGVQGEAVQLVTQRGVSVHRQPGIQD